MRFSLIFFLFFLLSVYFPSPHCDDDECDEWNLCPSDFYGIYDRRKLSNVRYTHTGTHRAFSVVFFCIVYFNNAKIITNKRCHATRIKLCWLFLLFWIKRPQRQFYRRKIREVVCGAVKQKKVSIEIVCDPIHNNVGNIPWCGFWNESRQLGMMLRKDTKK